MGTDTIGRILRTIRTDGKVKERIEAIRGEPDKDKRDELKKTLPCIVFGSEPQTERKAAACVPNGLLGVDVDGVEEGKLEALKKMIAEIPYVWVVCLSVSGRGLFVLTHYAGTPDLKKLLAAIQRDFPCEIDKACSDLCRMRFATEDKDIIIKDTVFPAILSEVTEPTNDVDNAESADEVDDPEPVPYVRFPVDCLPHTLAQFAKDAQRRINLKDPAMPAISTLAVVSSVIGSSCRIEIKRGHVEPAALYMANVADSGMAKSPSLEFATEHLDAVQAKKIKEYLREKHEWNQRHIAWKNSPKQSRGEEPMPPQPAGRHVIKEATFEATVAILANNPFGLLLNRDELNAFLGGFDAYRKAATDLQGWIEIYDGRAISTDRKETGTIYIDKPSISIIGGIQTDILKKTIQQRQDFIHSGLGSRFNFVMPEKEPIVWNMNTPNVGVVAAYNDLIDRILVDRESVLEKDDTGIGAFATVKPIIFTLSAEARKVLFAFQERHAMQAIYEPAAVAAAKHKAGRIAARLCLTLHCVRSIETTGRLCGLPEVSKETVENAVSLAGWFLGEAERVYAMIAGEPLDGTFTDEQQLVMKVLQNGKAMTVRDMKKKSRPLNRMSNEHVEGILAELVKLGKVDRYFDIKVGNHGAIQYQLKNPTTNVGVRPVFPGDCAPSADADTADIPKNELPVNEDEEF